MSGTDTPGGTPAGKPEEPRTNPPAPGQGAAGSGQFPPPAQPGPYPPAGTGPYQGPPPGTPPGPPLPGRPPGPPPPGSPPGQPPGPWGYGQPPGGPPPGGSGSNTKLWWIIGGAIAAFLALVLILVVVLVVAADDDGGGAAGGRAGNQSDAVKAYLTAVADGDAEKALSLAAVEPLDSDFLTDEVLEESSETAEITDIKVGEVANEFTSSVPATFRIGDQTVTEDFQVTRSGDGWKMNEVGSTIDFTSLRNNTLPLMLNGEEVDVDKVTLFPGAYTLTTGSDNITYGTKGEFTVKGSADYLNSSDLAPTLTPEGETAFTNAVKASARACLQKKDLSPANCPNEAGRGPYKLDKSTIKWSTRGGTDPFANLKPRLDYESPNVAEVRPNLQLTVKADCDSPSGRCSVDTYTFKSATADMLEEPLEVKWTD